MRFDKDVEEALARTTSLLPEQFRFSNTLGNRIIAWNRKRNGLRFDPNLEIRMLSEEFNEFFMAETTAHRIQEFSDIQFVFIGTCAKYYAQMYANLSNAWFDQWEDLLEWFEKAYGFAFNLVSEELEDYGLDVNYLDTALEYVVEANEAKGTEPGPDGKVPKGPNYVSPLARIEADLREVCNE